MPERHPEVMVQGSGGTSSILPKLLGNRTNAEWSYTIGPRQQT
jgi:hypothetical protein